MKFVVDAQLPMMICEVLRNNHHEAFHTSEILNGNLSSDKAIAEFATEINAIVITKDKDFYYSFLLTRIPPKLLLVKVGNMKLADLKALFENNVSSIEQLFLDYDLVELYPDRLMAVYP
jgi:predicted nuclease of predicted toxin-antitoxin system